MFVRLSNNRLLNVTRIAVIYPKEHWQARGYELDDDDDEEEAVEVDNDGKDVLAPVKYHIAVLDFGNHYKIDASLFRKGDKRWYETLNDNDLGLVTQAIEKTVGIL